MSNKPANGWTILSPASGTLDAETAALQTSTSKRKQQAGYLRERGASRAAVECKPTLDERYGIRPKTCIVQSKVNRRIADDFISHRYVRSVSRLLFVTVRTPRVFSRAFPMNFNFCVFGWIRRSLDGITSSGLSGRTSNRAGIVQTLKLGRQFHNPPLDS